MSTTIKQFSTRNIDELVGQYRQNLMSDLEMKVNGLVYRCQDAFGASEAQIRPALHAALSCGEVFEVREGDTTLALFGLILEPHRGLLNVFGFGLSKSALPLVNAVEELSFYAFSLGLRKLEVQASSNESGIFRQAGFTEIGRLGQSRLIDGRLEDTVILERFAGQQLSMIGQPTPAPERKYTPQEIAAFDENDEDPPRISRVVPRDTGLQDRAGYSEDERELAYAQLGVAPPAVEDRKARPRYNPLANKEAKSFIV